MRSSFATSYVQENGSEDSTTNWKSLVLDGLQYIQWLEMHSSQLYFFVGNRISELQQATGQVEWRHMPSAQNPAVKVILLYLARRVES